MYYFSAVAMISAFSRPNVEYCHHINNSDQSSSKELHTIPIADGTQETFPWNRIRLPSIVRPSQYYIRLQINLTDFYFNGSVSIVLQASQPTNYIIMHSNNLTISEYKIKSHKTLRMIEIEKMLVYKKWQMIAFKLKRTLYTNEELELSIKYNSPLYEKLTGLYRSSYIAEDGTKRLV